MHMTKHYDRVDQFKGNLLHEINWMEYVTILGPFIVLLLGVRSFRENVKGGKIGFFEGFFERLKIAGIGGEIGISRRDGLSGMCRNHHADRFFKQGIHGWQHNYLVCSGRGYITDESS